MIENTRVKEIYDDLIKQDLSGKYKHAGLYCIKLEGKIVYIGKSKNMLQRIAEHMAEIENKNIRAHKYKILQQAQDRGITIQFDVLYYSTRVLESAIEKDIGRKEGIYIRRYRPPLNYQIPKVEDWHKFKVNKEARKVTLDEILRQSEV